MYIECIEFTFKNVSSYSFVQLLGLNNHLYDGKTTRLCYLK